MAETAALEKAPEHPPHGSLAGDDTSHGTAHGAAPRGRYLLTLSIAALGVVYGDIGTSPLYAIRECFHGPHAIAPTPGNVMGVLSLVFWRSCW